MTRTTTFDVNAIRAHFPALRGGAAHFDGPGGSQTPDTVADAIRHAMLSPLANRGTITRAERNAEEIVGQCRRALGDLLNADPDGVIFGRSMTAVTFDLSRTLSATWRSGDEIVVSRLDHDANVRPWIIAADKAGVVVRWADFDLEAQLSPRTRLVAITAASNLIGTMPDIKAVAAVTHSAGALLYVDGGARAMKDAIAAKITTLPQHLLQSLTWDRGKEIAQHAQLTIDTGLPVYFADPHSPWQRGTNENTNGLLRQYFPKETDLARWNDAEIDAVAMALNNRPRKTLGWRTPAEALNDHLRSVQSAGVATTH